MTGTVEQREQGYRVAAGVIEGLPHRAAKQRPRRVTAAMRKSASYREGYWEGLLMAHCMHALGRYPAHPDNAARIARHLSE